MRMERLPGAISQMEFRGMGITRNITLLLVNANS